MENEKYFIKPNMARKPRLLVKVNDEWINLKGEKVTETIPANKKYPAREVVVRGAKQEDLALLIENPGTYGDYSRIIGVRKSAEEISAEINSTIETDVDSLI